MDFLPFRNRSFGKAILQKTAMLLCAVATLLLATALPQTLSLPQGENYTFYCGDTSRNCRIITPTYPLFAKAFLHPQGESTIYTNLDIDAFFAQMGATVIYVEELLDCTNYYAQAPLPYAVSLYGTTINLHVCVRTHDVMVGTPIIFGGY